MQLNFKMIKGKLFNRTLQYFNSANHLGHIQKMSVCGAVLMPSGHSTQVNQNNQELSPLEREFRHLDECCSWSLFYEVKFYSLSYFSKSKIWLPLRALS